VGGAGGRAVDNTAGLTSQYLDELSKARKGVARLMSAEAYETSIEDARWGGGHGVFTYHVLEGLRGAADADRDGKVTVGELFEYVRRKVIEETEKLNRTQ